MSIGIFTGTIKLIERKQSQEGDNICNVWLNLAEFSDQTLRATAWNGVADSMAHLIEGETITVTGVIDIEAIDRPGIKKKILAMPTISQVAPLNQIMLAGRAGADPKVQRFAATDTREATTLATVNLAVRSRREDPNWFSLEIWGRTAEIVEQYVQTGSLIEVIGTIRLESWRDRQTGEDRAKPVVRVDRVQLLGGKREDSDQSPSESTSSLPAATDSTLEAALEAANSASPSSED
ncbi:MAG TPA: single-stranded DNA-binding protein [Leptolyngbya sp.]|nr:single-stranded DNA-binding protein [Leptolyngbya sp.]